MDWQEELITLYLFISKRYEEKLKYRIERRTNNKAHLKFADEEVITIYLFGIMKKRKTIKDIYNYTEDHLKKWFPKLPKYEAFAHRVKNLCSVFEGLAEDIQKIGTKGYIGNTRQLIDSMPIVLAKGARRFSAKVANEIATGNGYCASKKMHYYGVKLHVVGKYRNKSLPEPMLMIITEAGMNDRKAYEQIKSSINKGDLFADKAYQIGNKPIFIEDQLKVHTPVKKQKGQKRLAAAEQLLSTAVSKIRQPIEAFFGWLEEKTSIQMAGKVRSCKGLLSHIFARISVALLLFFTPNFNF